MQLYGKSEFAKMAGFRSAGHNLLHIYQSGWLFY